MKRTTWVLGACLLGGLMVAVVHIGLQSPARAAEQMAPTANPGDVVINEVAWMGTVFTNTDEWIELYNTTDDPITLTDWFLEASSGGPDIRLSGVIPPHGYFLLERTDDQTVADIAADQIYGNNSTTWALTDSGEVLTLTDALSNVIDTANADGGNWPAGSASPNYYTMERIDPTAPDTDANWASNNGIIRNGLDASGNPINGTPKAQNSCYQPPAAPTADLSVAKSGPLATAPGSLMTYTIVLSNTGSITATGTLLTDTLPAGVTCITQTGPFTLLASEPLVWDAGDVLTGATFLITVTARVSRDVHLSIPTGVLVNVVTATTTASETVTANNSAAWTTTIPPRIRLYALAPVNHDGSKEAAALINLDPYTVSLGGWRLDDAPTGTGAISFPVTATIGPGQILWLAQDADGFYPVWGFDADWAAQAITRTVPRMNGSWPGFTDGDEAAYLLTGTLVVDALAYGSGSASQGWSGPAVPYKYANYADGQVLYRKLDQATGRPVPDTDTAADWAQDPADPINGRKLRYPGWDLEALFFPAEIAATANVTLAAAPDGAFDLVSQTIASAQHTLRIEAYTFESLALYHVISDRIRAGVVVTIMLESGPPGGIKSAEKWIAQRLHNPPTSTVYFIGKTAARYHFQHAKFILVDERLALVSTDNLGENGLPSDRKDNGTLGHRGFVAVTDSPGVIARLAEIFRRDCDPEHHLDVAAYSDAYAPPADFTPLPPPDWTTYTARFSATLATTATHFTVLHAPEHALRERDSLLGLIGRTASGDQIAVMQLNEPFTWTAGAGEAGLNPRLQALVAAARRGASVRVLLDEYYDNGSNITTCLALNAIAAQESLGLTCRLVNVTGLGIHAKVFLVSTGAERWVHLGSINGTETSSKANREVALQFRSAEAYEYVLAVFDHDWTRAHGPMVHRIHLPLVLRDYVPPADYPLISEVYINPPEANEPAYEWIELYNPGPDVSIAGWTLGDAINVGDYGDGRYAFPAEAHLLRGQTVVVAACATTFAGIYGHNPDYEWTNCSDVPDLVPVGAWSGFGLALGNSQDEVLLLNGSNALVDSVAWGGTARVGVTPFTAYATTFPAGASLRRWPRDTDRNDCSRDFYIDYSPTPGVMAND